MTPSPLFRRLGTLVVTAMIGGSALAACSSGGAGEDGTGGSASGGAGSGNGPSIVASTGVYADIARQVAGPDADIESVISDPNADPHSYEASPADAAAVAMADLVVYNGAGYDAFVDQALATASDVPVVRAVDEFARVTSTTVEGHSHGAGDSHGEGDGHATADGHAAESGSTTNEHVWFSMPTAAAVAERVAEELASLDAENATVYRDNAQRFAESLTPLTDQVNEIGDRGHFAYAQTEPIGAHLFEAAHLQDLTPHGFLASIEDDTDPSAADLTATLELVRSGEVSFLAFNTQTETPVTARVRDAAQDAGLVVVELSENLPDGEDYLTWMTTIVGDLTAALDGARPTADAAH